MGGAPLLATAGAAAPERFAAGLDDAFDRAAASHPVARVSLEVGDVRVDLRVAHPTLARLIERAMGHLASGGDATLRLDVFAGGTLPAPPWPLEERPKGEIGSAEPSSRWRACFQQELPALHLYDRAERRGWIWYRDPERLPSWEHPHLPLRALHFALADLGWFAVHGAALERDGVGVLLPGKSGTGKTTTAIAALAGGWRFLGDDHVLVRAAPVPEVASLFATTRLTSESERLLAPLGLAAPVAAPPTPPSDKALFYVADFAGARLGRRSELAAIVLPRRAERAGAPVPAAPAAALRELAPSTLLFLPHAAAIGSFAELARLVRRVPAFHLPLGRDLAEVAPALERVAVAARQARDE